MEMPKQWNGNKNVIKVDGQVIGNDAEGHFIGVHSLAVRPQFQGKGLGRALMNEYIKYAGESIDSAQSVVIIAHDHLIKFYESFGFKNLGPSPCAFGGGGWYDMVSLSYKILINNQIIDWYYNRNWLFDLIQSIT